MRRHPIARAVRVDKLQVVALEAALVAHATGDREALPVWRMLREPVATVRRRARRLAELLPGAAVVASQASVGGGSLPGSAIASAAVEVRSASPDGLATRLRVGRPSVVARTDDGRILLDLRTVADDEVDDLARAVRRALAGSGDG
ncbi:MAG: L-seryl-tRNA(Sec) selenium transferase, partial [Actinomycetota bacterium]